MHRIKNFKYVRDIKLEPLVNELKEKKFFFFVSIVQNSRQ